MDFLENLTSVFTAAVVPASPSVYQAASAMLSEGFGFIGCSELMKWNLRHFAHVIEVFALPK